MSDSEGTATKRRNSARTRQALLAAASELFGTHGYAGTTVRQIGEQAGVDPALIARYFGSKAALYVASLDADGATVSGAEAPSSLLADEQVADLIRRVAHTGPSPVLEAAVRPTDDPAVAEAARRILGERLIAPLERRIVAAGLDRPRLRAELAVAALTGVVLARATPTFEELATASIDDVAELAVVVAIAVCGEAPTGQGDGRSVLERRDDRERPTHDDR